MATSSRLTLSPKVSLWQLLTSPRPGTPYCNMTLRYSNSGEHGLCQLGTWQTQSSHYSAVAVITDLVPGTNVTAVITTGIAAHLSSPVLSLFLPSLTSHFLTMSPHPLYYHSHLFSLSLCLTQPITLQWPTELSALRNLISPATGAGPARPVLAMMPTPFPPRGCGPGSLEW